MARLFYILIDLMLLGYILFAALIFHKEKDNAECRGIQVVVADSVQKHFVSKVDLVAQLQKDGLSPLHKPMRTINTEKIERDLLKNTMLSSVQVFKTPARTVKIEVTQKMPVLRVMSLTGNYYIDSEGTTMPVSYRSVIRVPVATGYVEKEFAKNDLYKFALFLQGNDFWSNQIEQIYVNSDKEVELVPRVGDQRIILGSFENFEEKLDNLRLFYEQAIPKIGWEKYSVINLKFKGQIVCTKK